MENKERVSKSTMGTLPETAAVDFDGTLVNDDWTRPIGADWINHDLFKKLKKKQKEGWKIVLWTCRSNGHGLEEAVEFCRQQGLEFDAVNENIKEVQDMFGYDTRKVWATLYIDDKARVPKFPKKKVK